ncbi:hypothetical protein Q2T40_21120 [Winogradskyella maritima]|nr:hypothetical protein [Winogradskyella maritima]
MCHIENSSFYAYFGLQTHSSLGIEREESHDEEKLNIPFCNTKRLASIVSVLSALNNRHYSFQSLLENELAEEIKLKEEVLDKEVISSFNFTDQEKGFT